MTKQSNQTQKPKSSYNKLFILKTLLPTTCRMNYLHPIIYLTFPPHLTLNSLQKYPIVSDVKAPTNKLRRPKLTA